MTEHVKRQKIHISRDVKQMQTHVTVTIMNGQGNEEILKNIKKTLIKMRRLFGISYAVTEVDFPE